MKYRCTICKQVFDDDGDAMIHIAFGHKMMEILDPELLPVELQQFLDKTKGESEK